MLSGHTDRRGDLSASILPKSLTLSIATSFATKPLVKVTGVGHATDSLALQNRSDLTSLSSTKLAAQKAFHMAGLKPADINLAEIHDSFTIAELIVLESLGFFKEGFSGKATEEGKTRTDGSFPVNPSGGLKAKGNPLGATGIAQIVELTCQLRQTAGARQVRDARRGLAHNMGGTGGSAFVSILETA